MCIRDRAILEQGSGDVTQEAVDEAALALTQAIKDLRKIPDRDALKDLIAQVEGIAVSKRQAHMFLLHPKSFHKNNLFDTNRFFMTL